MMKRVDTSHANPHKKTQDTQTSAAVTDLPRSIQPRKPKQKKISRKVQFAQPLAEQRVFDKTLSPNAETNNQSVVQKSKSAIKDLEPPLSLVAHFDLAAKKLNARQTKSVVEDVSSSKTIKSTKSSIGGVREVHRSPSADVKQGKKT